MSKQPNNRKRRARDLTMASGLSHAQALNWIKNSDGAVEHTTRIKYVIGQPELRTDGWWAPAGSALPAQAPFHEPLESVLLSRGGQWGTDVAIAMWWGPQLDLVAYWPEDLGHESRVEDAVSSFPELEPLVEPPVLEATTEPALIRQDLHDPYYDDQFADEDVHGIVPVLLSRPGSVLDLWVIPVEDPNGDDWDNAFRFTRWSLGWRFEDHILAPNGQRLSTESDDALGAFPSPFEDQGSSVDEQVM